MTREPIFDINEREIPRRAHHDPEAGTAYWRWADCVDNDVGGKENAVFA
jgi:hypothetical protein